MSSIVKTDRFLGKKMFRMLKILLDIGAINCYSHLEVGASSHHLLGIGSGAVNSITPYAANCEEAISLIALPRDGFSAFIVIIPVIPLNFGFCRWR